MSLARSEPDAAASPAIRLRGVSKRFRKHTSRGDYTTLKSSVVRRWLGGERARGEFVDVLDGIDLEINAGTTLGIIGRNGSGKSTLLKLIAGILQPDEGEVDVRGAISPLIELGAGFHPEFSGRENVLLNGLVLGLSREGVERQFDSIVRFAELADSIDEPVRAYSSGMYMRLAFSVAVHAAPDILLIDEILTVGDEAFVSKCQERLAAFQAAGKTIVIVSHDLDAIQRWCHEAIWIDEGRVTARGFPYEVVRDYHSSVERRKSDDGSLPKGELRDSRRPGELIADIEAVEGPDRSPEAHHILFRTLLGVVNRGDTVWRSFPPTRRGMVMVGGRLFRGESFVAETQRALIPRDVYPGERVCVELKFTLPEPGRYRVAVDLLAEGIRWFSDEGSNPLSFELEA